MGKLDKITSSCSGYFRNDGEEDFPWEATQGVWYSLFLVEDGKIEKYGFTSGKGQKEKLRLALKEVTPEDNAELIGVWTGQWNTHLFILDIEKAIEKLGKL